MGTKNHYHYEQVALRLSLIVDSEVRGTTVPKLYFLRRYTVDSCRAFGKL